MTREEFIRILRFEKNYSYDIVGDKIIITGGNGYGGVNLNSLKTIPPGVKFNNRGSVYLESLKTIPPGVEFNNRGGVILFQLKEHTTWFNEWNGNIEGISPNTLLNGMIKRGMFI